MILLWSRAIGQQLFCCAQRTGALRHRNQGLTSWTLHGQLVTRAAPLIFEFVKPQRRRPVLLVAIAGGSGSGKTWLAEKLAVALAPHTCRISLDDFYLDRSHVPLGRRSRINFDHPSSIDWKCLEKVVKKLRSGRAVSLPCYDFATHCRLSTSRNLTPKPVVLIDGLWALRRPSLRRLFGLRIFLDCPERTRYRRRLARDMLTRGRTRQSVREQFLATVQPMHEKYVSPQSTWADFVLRGPWGEWEVQLIACLIRLLQLKGI